MSKNRGDYVAAHERFSGNSSVRPSHEDVAAFAHKLEIDQAREDGMAEEHWLETEREIGVIDGKTTTT
jgi:hypothetical protein